MRCENCGKEFPFDYYDKGQYIYKVTKRDARGEHDIAYFCGFNCREQYNRKRAEEIERRKREIVEKRLATRMKNKEEKKDGI